MKRAISCNELSRLAAHRFYRNLCDDQSTCGDFIAVVSEQLQHNCQSVTEHYLPVATPGRQEAMEARIARLAMMVGRRMGEATALLGVHERTALPANMGEQRQLSQYSWLTKEWEGRHWVLPVQDASEEPTDTMVPSAPGLLRQYHDLDRSGTLAAHLNALQEQLLPDRQKPGVRLQAWGKSPCSDSRTLSGAAAADVRCLDCRDFFSD